MSLITVKSANPKANGKLGFWFDTDKPRRSIKAGYKHSLNRMNAVRLAQGKEPLKEKDVHSRHHIDFDRENPNPDNLLVCKSQEQHNHVELQAQEAMSQLVKAKIIDFDFNTLKYFVAWKPLEKKLRGEPRDGKRKTDTGVNALHEQQRRTNKMDMQARSHGHIKSAEGHSARHFKDPKRQRDLDQKR